MLRDTLAGWGEEIMAIEPSAMRGWLASAAGRRSRGPRADVNGVAVEWDECGMARMGGVALVCIEGPLSRVGSWWGGMGYDQILEAHDRAFRSDARAVLQVGHSPGGYISGMDECAEAIVAMQVASDKPLHALSADMMYSAAFRLACAASRIDVTRAGGVGSVGIKVTREDWTKFNELAGIRYEQVTSGSQKNDGDPDVPITKDEIARIAGRVEHHFQLFGGAVARARSMTLEDVRAQQAALFLGQGAVTARMADGVSTLQEAVARLESMTSGPARVQVPAALGGQQQAKGHSMEIAMLAVALGLASDAKDQDISARAAALIGIEARLKRETTESSADAAFAAIDGWRANSGKLEAAQKELTDLRAKDDAREYSALFTKGEAEGKITPANEKSVREQHTTAAHLGAFLKTALPGVPGRANADATAAHKGGKGDEGQKGSGGDDKPSALTYNGKAWADMKPAEQAALFREDEAKYHEMRGAAMAQKGGSR